MNKIPPNDSWQGRTWDEINFGTYIYGKGEKVTQARTRVLIALSKFDHPISIKELGKSVSEHNTSTIYRTLETLVQIGLVRQISIDPKESFYEINIGRPHHHHIICTSCGKIEAINSCAHFPSQKIIKSKKFSSITSHNLEFFGLCDKCAVV